MFHATGVTEAGLKIRVPFGTLEKEHKMEVSNFYRLLEMKKDELVGTPINAGAPQSDVRATRSGVSQSGTSEEPSKSKILDDNVPSDISDGLFEDDLGSPELL